MKYFLSFIFVLGFGAMAHTAHAQEVRDIVFPVQGEFTFTDDFGNPRGGGRTHEGNDILAEKHTPVVSATDGVVTFAPMQQPSYGWVIYIKDDDGYTYAYIHMNNDNPGTDDGMGGRDQGIASHVVQGAHISAGEVIGWVGDSGNAESTASHLHFEIRDPNDVAINPFASLNAALEDTSLNESSVHEEESEHENEMEDETEYEEEEEEYSYNPEQERTMATSIDDDKDLEEEEDSACEHGSLISSTESDAVYYCARNGKRYAFQNSRIYFSWYEDFDDVEQISPEELAEIPFGGVVTYKPGVKLVKITSVPKVYAVSANGTLQWVQSEEMAIALFGEDWADEVDDIPDAFFNAYTIGEPIR